MHSSTVGSWEGAVSYELGAPVGVGCGGLGVGAEGLEVGGWELDVVVLGFEDGV